jgi:glyoxylase-like metal-dependent hydrolase (beta-lactamase superfamily II)
VISAFIDLFAQDCMIEQITNKIIACKCTLKEEHRSFTILSKNGLVQIDSYYFPLLTKDAKDLIINETGRDDFKYFINTHGHACHTGGNYYFKDATFIAHERTKGKIEWGINCNKNEYDKLLISEVKDSTQIKRLEKLERQIKDTPLPQITFQDRLTIYLEDLTLHLIYFGKCGHSDDEILIHIPEEKTLIIGQIFHGSKYLPIIKAPCDRQDLLRKIDIMTQLMENDLEHILSNHQGGIDISDFKFAHDYYIDLLTNIENMRNKSYSLEQIQTEFKFNNRYPEINQKHEIKEDRENVHIKNVENIWKMMEKEKENS